MVLVEVQSVFGASLKHYCVAACCIAAAVYGVSFSTAPLLAIVVNAVGVVVGML